MASSSIFSTHAEGSSKIIPTSTQASEPTIQSTTYLKTWSVRIMQLNGTSIQVAGDTESYSDVDTIEVTLYLQYWNGMNWIDSALINTYTNNYTDYVYGAANISVTGDYYYRTKGIHYVNHGGSVEQINSYSEYIYIE